MAEKAAGDVGRHLVVKGLLTKAKVYHVVKVMKTPERSSTGAF